MMEAANAPKQSVLTYGTDADNKMVLTADIETDGVNVPATCVA